MDQIHRPSCSAAVAAAKGLTGAEAAARLAREGFNDLPSRGRHSAVAIAASVVREPMFALLLGAALLYALIGDLAEALVLSVFATASVSIAMIQRGRSERVLDALRDLANPRALVVRDGERRRIAGREVVRGDALVVTEGDRVPADAVLVSSGDGLSVDESLLTGESVPVDKQPARETADAEASSAAAGSPGPANASRLYSGTLILRGTGLALVTATGARSEMGKIGATIEAVASESPRLQVQTRRLVLMLAVAGLALSAFATVLHGLLRGDWPQALLGGIALGMSMLPEEFPLVLTVFMVMGARRLSRSRVLTRRPAAIETLGAATVLCTDKTGTLTRNMMSVVGLYGGGERWRARDGAVAVANSRCLAALLDTAVLASEPAALDPMERALHQLAVQAHGAGTPEGKRVHVYPLRRDRLAVTNVWDLGGEGEYAIAAKGAPEAIGLLCGMSESQRATLAASVDEIARQGIRVLGVASGRHARNGLPEDPAGLALQFVGLVGLADPLREAVPDAVRAAQAAGIRVVMITGDYPATARAIAREAGIDDGELLTGAELERMTDDVLAARARATTVYARIAPRQKLRIVEALKAAGEVVAMTGDGVNDAPALKAAHIGIAMGARGTDVAREASSLVLLDDDFGSIVHAIRLGRRIYDNLRKATVYVLAIHVPIAGLALLPLVLGEPLVLTPMLIALLELIIDPACSVVLEAEPEEADAMRRRPRDPRSPLFPRTLASWSVLQGVLALTLVAATFIGASRGGASHEEVRTVAFLTLVAAILALVFVNRTFQPSLRAAFGRPNPPLWCGLGLVAGALAALFAAPPIREFFGLGVPRAADFAAAGVAALGLLALLSFCKHIWGRRFSA
jgi:Ca2+-transporting ATPase